VNRDKDAICLRAARTYVRP